ncbi:MAG: hypothetical protein ACI93V_001212 [Alteromonadaceae bacterium]
MMLKRVLTVSLSLIILMPSMNVAVAKALVLAKCRYKTVLYLKEVQ